MKSIELVMQARFLSVHVFAPLREEILFRVFIMR